MIDKYSSPYGRTTMQRYTPPLDFSKVEQRIVANALLDEAVYQATTTARISGAAGEQMLQSMTKTLETMRMEEIRWALPQEYEAAKHYDDVVLTPTSTYRVTTKPVVQEPEVALSRPKQVTVRGSSYKNVMMDPKALAACIDEVCDVIPSIMKRMDSDVLVAVGTSGCAVVAPVAARLGVPWLLVRKASDKSHGSSIEGLYRGNGRAIFIDDCICSGATLEHAKNKLSDVDIHITSVVPYLMARTEGRMVQKIYGPGADGAGVWYQGTDRNAQSKASENRISNYYD